MNMKEFLIKIYFVNHNKIKLSATFNDDFQYTYKGLHCVVYETKNCTQPPLFEFDLLLL